MSVVNIWLRTLQKFDQSALRSRGLILEVKKGRIETISYGAHSRLLESLVVGLYSSMVQKLHRDEEKEAQGRIRLAPDPSAGGVIESRPNSGLQIILLTTHCLQWEDFVRETMSTPRSLIYHNQGK